MIRTGSSWYKSVKKKKHHEIICKKTPDKSLLRFDAASVEQMHYRTLPMSGFDFPGMDFYGYGFGWDLWGNGLQGHSGGTPGYFAQMLMQESESGPYGAIFMMTYGCSITECNFEWFDQYYIPIRELLLQEAAQILEQSEAK